MKEDIESIVIITDKDGYYRIMKYKGDILEKVKNRDSLELLDRKRVKFLDAVIEFITGISNIPKRSSKQKGK
jgi:hypothetical protein